MGLNIYGKGALVTKMLKGKIAKYGAPKEPKHITKVKKMLGGECVVIKKGNIINSK